MTLRERVAANWFFLVVPVLLLTEWLVVRDVGAEMGRFLEAVVLFDLSLFMPLLCLLEGLSGGMKKNKS